MREELTRAQRERPVSEMGRSQWGGLHGGGGSEGFAGSLWELIHRLHRRPHRRGPSSFSLLWSETSPRLQKRHGWFNVAEFNIQTKITGL